MINIVYDPESDLFIFMAKNTSEDADVSNIDELLEAVSGEFALFASCIAGSTRDAYLGLVDALEAAGQDISIKEGINELIENNSDTVFLNDEDKETCIGSITKSFKKEIDIIIDAMTKEKEGREEFAKEIEDRLVSKFIDNMQSMINTDVSYLFFEDEEEDSNDYEDDLF